MTLVNKSPVLVLGTSCVSAHLMRSVPGPDCPTMSHFAPRYSLSEFLAYLHSSAMSLSSIDSRSVADNQTSPFSMMILV